MLVLSRKIEESIFIGKDIEVTVLSVANGRVKLGIRAPQEVRVLRGELQDECESPQQAHPPARKVTSSPLAVKRNDKARGGHQLNRSNMNPLQNAHRLEVVCCQ